jgi:plastocyanin
MLRSALLIAVCVIPMTAQAPAKGAAPTEQPTIRFGQADYRPDGITVQSGQTVRFINTSDFTHTVTDRPLPAQKRTGSDLGDQLPSGEQPFDSGDIFPQQSWEHKFTTRGTYRFHCREHEPDRMNGVVVVR